MQVTAASTLNLFATERFKEADDIRSRCPDGHLLTVLLCPLKISPILCLLHCRIP